MPARDVTELLLEWNAGSPAARSALVTLLHRELRAVARRLLRSEPAGHTLQATALVHEAYLKLVDQRRVSWRDRAHFLAVAAGIMRRILVDGARRRHAQRRGGLAQRVELDDELPAFAGHDAQDVLEVDQALTELARLDPGLARVVELRYFGGLSVEEAAEALGVSRATLHRDWAMARAWLHRRLGDRADAP
jgi:RNA polymerase sigma factor (TIGR02999 family)